MKKKTAIIFIGIQACGKSTFYREQFSELVHINLDTLKTRKKENKLLEECDLPCLYEIDFDSVPKDAGEYLKKQWKGRLDYLSVRCLRGEGWLSDNLNNPLRHWDGSEFVPAVAYKKAVKCYKDTKKKLLSADSKEQVVNPLYYKSSVSQSFLHS